MNIEVVSIFMTCDSYHMYFKNKTDHDFKLYIRSYSKFNFCDQPVHQFIINKINFEKVSNVLFLKIRTILILEGPNAIPARFEINFLQITFWFLQNFSPGMLLWIFQIPLSLN